MIQSSQNFLEIEKYMNQRGVNTRGWLTADDSQAFVDSVHRMQDDGTCVIIGLYAGAQAVLARIVKPSSTVIGIDPLSDEINGTEWQSNGRHLYDVCMDSLTKSGVADSIEIIRDLSQNAGKTWTRPISVLLVDGDHHEEPAFLDLTLFGPHVVVGGELLIDDMNCQSLEVRRAYARWGHEEHTSGRTWEVIRQTKDEGPDKMWMLRRTA